MDNDSSTARAAELKRKKKSVIAPIIVILILN